MMGYVFMRFGADFMPENVDRMREKVGECLGRGNIPEPASFELLNLMDELICNVLEHGEATWIELEMHPLEHEVRLLFRDDGREFDPSEMLGKAKLADVARSEEGRNMGMYMIRQLAKSWKYRRAAGGVNELNLVFSLDKK